MRGTQRTAAFTLLELLVVLATLTLLLSLLAPSLGGARNSAKQSMCLVNQRTIGGAVMLYAADNESALVFNLDWAMAQSPWEVHRWSWDDFLDPYLGGILSSSELDSQVSSSHSKRMLVDPADWTATSPRIVNYAPSPTALTRSYAMTRAGSDSHYISSQPVSTADVGICFISGGSSVQWAVRENSSTVSWANANPATLSFHPLHLSDADFPRPAGTLLFTELFSDSNVQGNPQINFVSSHGDSTQPGRSMSGKPTPHPGGFNYLYADGHVETRNYISTKGTGSLIAPRGEWTRLIN